MKKNINESNVILLSEARELLAQGTNASKYPSLGQILTEIENRTKEVVLTEDEIAIEKFTTERQAEEAKLDSIVDAVKGIAYIHQKDLLKEAWLKRGAKKNSEFFELFFTELANAPAIIRTELTTIKSGAYAEYKAIYDSWKELVAKEDQKTERSEKINEAIDIKAGLIGICRMLGMTGFDIEKSISD
jgi:hypothetical protein